MAKISILFRLYKNNILRKNAASESIVLTPENKISKNLIMFFSSFRHESIARHFH